MRTFLNKFLVIAGASALMLASCKKDGVLVKTSGGTSGALTASANTLVLQKAKYSDTSKVISFKLTAADYGYSSATTTTLQLDAPGDNWANPQSVTLAPKVLSQGYSTADFNSILLKLNLPADKASQVSVRVMYSVTSSIAPVYSNVVSMTVTPFSLISYVYVPGAYQGWNIAAPDSLQSATGNGIYTGIIDFPNSTVSSDLQFKITPKKAWDNSYGLDASGNFKYNPNPGYAATGGNLVAPQPTSPSNGVTQVTVDLNANTISFDKPKFYYSIIGDATALGWGDDTNMKYNYATEMWEVTAPLTAGGAFKIRQNHDWGTSWGTLGTPDGKTLTSSNGGNISITVTGTYKITFKPTYGADGSVNATATYTLVKQ